MSEPMFFQHPCGLHLSVTETPKGYMLSAFNPDTGRTVYGFEETEDGAFGWAEGARLVLCDAEGSA